MLLVDRKISGVTFFIRNINIPPTSVSRSKEYQKDHFSFVLVMSFTFYRFVRSSNVQREIRKEKKKKRRKTFLISKASKGSLP